MMGGTLSPKPCPQACRGPLEASSCYFWLNSRVRPSIEGRAESNSSQARLLRCARDMGLTLPIFVLVPCLLLPSALLASNNTVASCST